MFLQLFFQELTELCQGWFFFILLFLLTKKVEEE